MSSASLGGRLMAIVAVIALVWLLLVGQRDEARRKLVTFTPSAHAATYQKAQLKLKETARASDGFLVAVAVVIGGMVVIYEAAAWGLGWAIDRLVESPRSGNDPDGT